jgi:hypothetical protein
VAEPAVLDAAADVARALARAGFEYAVGGPKRWTAYLDHWVSSLFAERDQRSVTYAALCASAGPT